MGAWPGVIAAIFMSVYSEKAGDPAVVIVVSVVKKDERRYVYDDCHHCGHYRSLSSPR